METISGPFLPRLDLRLVRGPLSRKAVGADDSLPKGDPALLCSEMHPVERDEKGPVIYLPNFQSRQVSARAIGEIGADLYEDIACTRERFWEVAECIGRARFVLNSALHGAIVAQAYGVPRALCVPKGARHNWTTKWRDWFASPGHDGCPKVADIREGKVWREQTGRFLKTPDLGPIRDSFPHDAAR